MNATQQLKVLKKQWTGCARCALEYFREGDGIVFGTGPAPADIMFIGSHPTESDEDAGRPLVGEEGTLLAEMLNGVGLNLAECYRAHIVACRPKILIPQTDVEEERIDTVPPAKEHYLGNRNPKKGPSHEGCDGRLTAQIYAVDPRIIITLGDVPLRLLGARDNEGKKLKKMADAQGNLFTIEIPGRYQPLQYPVMAALDVGFLIRNPSTADHGPIMVFMEALRRAKTYLNWIKKKEAI